MMDDLRPSEADVQEALNQYADELMTYPNVNGVGIQESVSPDGTTEPHIMVYVSQKLAPENLDASTKIPKKLDVTIQDPTSGSARQREVKVRVQALGDLKAQ